MPTSSSVAGKALIKHEAHDTLRRRIELSTGGEPVDLTGCTIEMIVSYQQDGEALHTLTIGEGIVATDLANGVFNIEWQTQDILEPRSSFWYKVVVTFPGGVIRTFLEYKLITL